MPVPSHSDRISHSILVIAQYLHHPHKTVQVQSAATYDILYHRIGTSIITHLLRDLVVEARVRYHINSA